MTEITPVHIVSKSTPSDWLEISLLVAIVLATGALLVGLTYLPRSIKNATTVTKLADYECRTNGGLRDLEIGLTPNRYNLVCRNGARFHGVLFNLRPEEL